jgi:PAS domain S-box-containing protein
VHRPKTVREPGLASTTVVRTNFRRIERREWWLWAAAVVITLLLTVGMASFLLPEVHDLHDFFSLNALPQALRGLVGLVFLFDLYTIYQHLLIFRIRRQLVQREELFHLISENAADMIAVVDLNGKRLFNSLSYQKVSGYSPEELQASSPFGQIHPDDRERVKEASEEAQRSGIGKTLEYRLRHKNGEWLVLESTSSVIRNAEGEPEKLVIVIATYQSAKEPRRLCDGQRQIFGRPWKRPLMEFIASAQLGDSCKLIPLFKECLALSLRSRFTRRIWQATFSCTPQDTSV